ncbi:MAG TPA: GTPase Era [Clostridiales bacterium]|nr:GTPase Era [Clostridiales bacterium]HPV01564.1 GTPase Era [Clostridiales bacterium]
MFKSGFVSIIGRPNVGKSTLTNRLIGEKLSIISSKPQTTRNAIKAIVNTDDSQIIIIDTPGIHKPKTKLGEYMVKLAEGTLNEVDIILFLVEATDRIPGAGDLYIIEQLKSVKMPVILIINKIDLVNKEELPETIKNFSQLLDFRAVVPISATSGDGTDIVIEEIKKLLPEGPKYFPDDVITDQPERMLAAELIREKILELLSDEVPHGTGIEIISFRERKDRDMIDIEANIYCERESHKGIIIGKQGAMLKKIGTLARVEMENLFGVKVFLKLWVKVKPDWRNSASMLKTLGYQ